MNLATLNAILEKIPSLRVTLIGDGCVDIYWHADMTKSEPFFMRFSFNLNDAIIISHRAGKFMKHL